MQQGYIFFLLFVCISDFTITSMDRFCDKEGIEAMPFRGKEKVTQMLLLGVIHCVARRKDQISLTLSFRECTDPL